eukprot:513362_1
MTFIAFNVGGSCGRRDVWRQFPIYTVKAIIFVVDANDREKINDSSGFDWSAREVFHGMRPRYDENVAWLILANKMDTPNAMSVNEVNEQMSLHGEGLSEGLNWLKANIGYIRIEQRNKNGVGNPKWVKIRRDKNKNNCHIM